MGFPKPMHLHGLRIIVDGELSEYLTLALKFFSARPYGKSVFDPLKTVVDFLLK